jgi:hypothetical protein
MTKQNVSQPLQAAGYINLIKEDIEKEIFKAKDQKETEGLKIESKQDLPETR